MRAIIFCFFFVAKVFQTLSAQNIFEQKVINGTDAPLGKYPSMVSFQINFSHSCGGTILNEYFFMTAAHCITNANVKFLSAVSGSNDLSEGGSRHQVTKIMVHEAYNPAEWYVNDIAVLKVATPFAFDANTAAVVLPAHNQQSTPGATATLVGWGLSVLGVITTDVQQEVDLVVYSDEECDSIHEGKPHPTNICAGVPGGGKGQCTGDSGGPLYVDGYQAGIVSWSRKPCGIAPYPGVYTEVAPYIDWLNSKSNVTEYL